MPAVPGISHVIFDLGQVLSLVDETVAVRAVVARSGRTETEVNTALFSPDRKRPLESGFQTWNEFSAMICSELALDMDDAEFRDVFTSVLTPNEPMFDIVRSLSRRFTLGCCSNTSGPHWEEIRASVPVTELFGPRILSFEVGSMKPDQQIYRALINACGVEPGQIVFIDDSPRNVESATAAGIRALLFTGVPNLERDLHALGIEWE
ncbi:MAG: HAD family phosphatase [Dehalococcoidia bacterium]|jgi:HAD superfamily hydrolase (TIGR01509 family)|nr:HAD family phosphatase [Dehalococcoidia bacterium]